MNLIITSAALGGPVLNVRQENRCGVCQSLAEGVGNREEGATVPKQAPNPKTRAPKCQLSFLSLALGNASSGGVEGDGYESPLPVFLVAASGTTTPHVRDSKSSGPCEVWSQR